MRMRQHGRHSLTNLNTKGEDGQPSSLLLQGKTNMLQVFYKSKKDLKANIGEALLYRETSVFGLEYKSTGTFVVADGGPRRSWYAEVTMKDHLIVEVK
jgi:hypothetical protein